MYFNNVSCFFFFKVQERAASLDHCPWCSKKGLTYPLRLYHINLEESISLCTNPQCLFPLVSRPLEDVLASLVPVEPTTGNKRKNPTTPVADEPYNPSPKRLRLNDELDGLVSKSDTQNNETETNGHNTEALNGNVIDASVDSTQAKVLELSQAADNILAINSTTVDLMSCLTSEKDDHILHSSEASTTDKVLSSFNNSVLDGKDNCPNNVALGIGFSLQDVNVLSNKSNASSPHTEALGETEPIPFVEDTCSKSSTKADSEKLLSPPTELFWSNRDKLCWLDSLLVALVNLRHLRKLKPKEEPELSPVWRLLSGYDEACAAIEAHKTDSDGFLKVPDHLLHKVNNDLETLRMSVFNLLQPKLHCKLGQNETPVFALPLLTKMDSWLEPCFQSRFNWNFRCRECKSTTKENVVKTLPTFTDIVPDWHPLRAVHLAPCNVCHRKNQRRRMVLERVPPVFALHFVEGLPDNNIEVYNFNFKKKHFSVTAVIQYNTRLKHFVTWVHKCDGSWMEFDDMKHPYCKTYKALPVPAQDIHVVFWEEEEQRQESRACSPSSTFTESPPSTNKIDHNVLDTDDITEDLSQCISDQSLLNQQNDTDIMCALSEQDTTIKADFDTSIGSATLLDTFEGLSHSDMITLTLVELNDDSKTQPINSVDAESDQTQDSKCPDVNNVIHGSKPDICTPAPDSSSTLKASETHKEADSELSTVSEPDDNLSDDPTFEPKTRRRGKTSKAAPAKPAKKQKVGNPKSKAAPKVATDAPVSEVKSTPTTLKPPSPVSSTVSAPQPAPVVQEQQKGWSTFLKRSFNHIQNISPKIIPTPIPKNKQKPITIVSSTPKMSRVPVLTTVPPKPVLRKDESGLHLKAAEMYGAFGSKKTNASTVNVNKKPLESPIQNLKMANSVVNCSLNSTSIPGVQPEIISSKRTKTPKLPPGLSETQALRYKLLKKLKAKKKKLAKLNEMLGQQGDASFKPDSTTVTSSTYDSSTCDEFLSELLSPATTITSNLSPDSTEYLEMFTNAQEAAPYDEMQMNPVVQGSAAAEGENFLDEFMSQAVAERPTEMEAEALSALDLFF